MAFSTEIKELLVNRFGSRSSFHHSAKEPVNNTEVIELGKKLIEYSRDGQLAKVEQILEENRGILPQFIDAVDDDVSCDGQSIHLSYSYSLCRWEQRH